MTCATVSYIAAAAGAALIIGGSSVLLAATPATAATITRSGDRLVLTGIIQQGDDTAFAAALDGDITTVVLGSGGGRLNEAMQIGRIIRGRGLNTSVPSACESACVLIWAGGKMRTVGGELRVHCPTQPGSPYQCDAPGRQRMVRYLKEMNTPAGVVRMQEAVNWMALKVTPEQLAEAPEARPVVVANGEPDDLDDEPLPPPPRRRPPPPYYGPTYPPPPPPPWAYPPPWPWCPLTSLLTAGRVCL
jgi:hypothetical protein